MVDTGVCSKCMSVCYCSPHALMWECLYDVCIYVNMAKDCLTEFVWGCMGMRSSSVLFLFCRPPLSSPLSFTTFLHHVVFGHPLLLLPPNVPPRAKESTVAFGNVFGDHARSRSIFFSFPYSLLYQFNFNNLVQRRLLKYFTFSFYKSQRYIKIQMTTLSSLTS